MSMPGAVNDAKDATEEIQKICDQVSFNLPSSFTISTYSTGLCILFWICCMFIKMKAKVEDRTKKMYEEFRAVKYKQQIVAGVNFFIKVTNIVISEKLFKSLRCAVL